MIDDTGGNLRGKTMETDDGIPSGTNVSRDILDEQVSKAWNGARRRGCNVLGGCDVYRCTAVTLHCSLH